MYLPTIGSIPVACLMQQAIIVAEHLLLMTVHSLLSVLPSTPPKTLQSHVEKPCRQIFSSSNQIYPTLQCRSRLRCAIKISEGSGHTI